MKRVYKIAFLAGLTMLVSSCHNEQERNYEYFPNMYEAVSYETYSESDVFRGGMEAQLPAPGSIKRGFVPYGVEDSNAGYVSSKSITKSGYAEMNMGTKVGADSLSVNMVNMDDAKVLYDIYCAICHGTKGDGKGKLVTQEKFLGIPSYKEREITVGSVFHVETYGLNAMGSYSSQLDAKERWMVAEYVMKLKSEL